MIAEHTKLTTRAFAGFTGSMFALGMLSVGFGAIDLAMVAPLGIEQVAAVGLGDAVVVLILAFAAGIIDIFTSRLAMAEGSGTTNRRLPVLLIALGLVLLALQGVAVVIALVLSPILYGLGQPDAVVPPASDYASARLLYGLLVTLAMTMTLEVLKVIGLRNWSVAALGIGLVLNVVFNWLMLYGPLASWFPSPAGAVAWSTVAAQGCMAIFGVVALIRGLRARDARLERPSWRNVRSEAISIGTVGSGIGVRHLNDYVGSTVPFLLMGTLGVQTLAAVTVATRIWTLFCRVPQACFTSSFIFYGYAMDRSRDEAHEVRRRVLRMSAWPTVIGAVAFLAASPLLVRLLAGPQADLWVVLPLVAAYFLGLLPYFFSGFYGELLMAHQEGAFLSISSTVVTYALVLPLAAAAVFVLNSAFFAIASITLATISTAVLFTRRYHRIAARARAKAES